MAKKRRPEVLRLKSSGPPFVAMPLINWNFRWSFVCSIDQKTIQPGISVSNQKILADRSVRRWPFCLPLECLKPEHYLPSPTQSRLPCWLGSGGHGKEVQALSTTVLSGWAGRWGSRVPHRMQIYLQESVLLARPLVAGWSSVSLLILIPHLSHSFQLLLGSHRLLHWCGGFLATTCVTCVSWSYLTGGWVELK